MSCCPPNPSTLRTLPYCKPVISRSEPLSHSEYLRMRKASNAPVSASSLLQIGDGSYKKTIWTAAPSCCNTAVPAVTQAGIQASLTTKERGAIAARGTLSQYDTTNRTEWNTTYRAMGLAIATDKYPTCACGITGTTAPTVPGTCKCE
jgi:hypothetical protein